MREYGQSCVAQTIDGLPVAGRDGNCLEKGQPQRAWRPSLEVMVAPGRRSRKFSDRLVVPIRPRRVHRAGALLGCAIGNNRAKEEKQWRTENSGKQSVRLP